MLVTAEPGALGARVPQPMLLVDEQLDARKDGRVVHPESVAPRKQWVEPDLPARAMETVGIEPTQDSPRRGAG
jgi:hypothetical protein